jgi:16S rRNA (cytosine967-C5)-methyltransferase
MIRRLAWELLRGGGPASRRVAAVAAEHGLEPRDRALLARIVQTEARRRSTLHALVRAFARGKPSRDLAAFLRLGLVQLFFLDRVPGHAAISETVGAASECLGLSKGKYVNAVLRAAQRAVHEGASGDPTRDLVGRELHLAEPLFPDPAEHPHLWAEAALSIPAPLHKGWVKRFGAECADELARSLLEDPRVSLRVVRGDRESLLAELAAMDLSAAPAEHPAVLTVAPAAVEQVLRLEAFAEGRLTVQGEAALHAAELCAAREGERWLDLCAAPGGKTAVLAGAGAHVTACDVEPGKLRRLAETVGRLGLGEAVEAVLLEADGEPPQGEFDGVLVDAPCSNTGVLARRPEARWRLDAGTRASLEALQGSLLERAASRVRPGGRLVHSTCSLEPFENEQRVRRFLEAHPEFTLQAERLTLPRPSDPRGPVDGGYAALLLRSDS